MDVNLSIDENASAGTQSRVQPFRPFFLLAAVDAIAGVGMWWAAVAGIIPANWAGTPIGIWHRQELLFGMIPAGLAGFLLTALPRWSGSDPISPPALGGLIVLWLAGRAAHVAAPAAAGPIAASFIAVLALIVLYQVIAHDRRNIKVGALLVLLAAGALTSGEQPFAVAGEYGSRASLAAILGFGLIIGGRVVPTVTAAALAKPPETFHIRSWLWIEWVAAAAAVVGLGAWVVAPAAYATAVAGAVAAVSQTARLLQWRFWRTIGMPGVLVLHLGYGWIPVGFALVAVRLVRPDFWGTDAVVHAWAVGVIGLLCLGVWASMIRRQTGVPFEFSPLVTAAYACGFVAAVARLLAAYPAGANVISWLQMAAFAWIAAYALFLAGFAQKLLRSASAPAEPI